MSVLINFKICSNDWPCNVPPVCPTGAVWWDKADKTLKVDNSKCISCGACVRVCPIMAIKVAKTQQEYEKIQAEYDVDPRRAEDLKIDRYGAGAFDTPTLRPEQAKDFIAEHTSGVVCLELQPAYEELVCQLMAIPIKELFDLEKVAYRAVADGKEIAGEYGVSALPALVFFKNGKQIGKIDGYFENSAAERALLEKQIAGILGK